MRPVLARHVRGVCFFLAIAAAPFIAPAGEEYGAECAVCHEDVVVALKQTSHAVAPGWDPDAACQTCHGDGTAHMESAEASDIVRPSDLAPREASALCLDCHSRQEKHFNSGMSIHGLGDVSCTDCHNPHSKKTNMLDVGQLELCSSCHKAISAQFDLPRSHPIGDESQACAMCHEPHGQRSLRVSTPQFDQTCSSCHFEKAGPFVYAHDTTIVDGCAGCHEVHGSPNRHLLTHEPQVNLCYQCHSANVTPGWHSAPRFLNEKCTACHSAIHGSNTSHAFLEE